MRDTTTPRDRRSPSRSRSPGATPTPVASAAELDVTTHRSTPAIRAASRMPAVPRMFTAANRASDPEARTSTAPRCGSRTGTRAARGPARPGERRSPVTVTTPGGASHSPRTRARTRYPRASSAASTCDPTNPDAPVRKTSPLAGRSLRRVHLSSDAACVPRGRRLSLAARSDSRSDADVATTAVGS